MKIGFYSGTFDPIHVGHQSFVENVLKQDLVNRIYIAPEPETWRKQPVAIFADRLAMLQAVFKDDTRVVVLDSEFEGLGSKHTVSTTLDWLKKKHPEGSMNILMGGDVFEHLPEWTDFNKLSGAVSGYIVGLRSEDDGELAVEIANKHSLSISMVTTTNSSVSSSKIRSLGVDRMRRDMPSEAVDYAMLKKLYSS